MFTFVPLEFRRRPERSSSLAADIAEGREAERNSILEILAVHLASAIAVSTLSIVYHNKTSIIQLTISAEKAVCTDIN